MIPSDSPIALIEDNDDDVFFMRRAMEKAGIANPLIVLRSGKDCQAYLAGDGDYADRGRHPLPGLMLLDLKLPLMGGLQVLEWIRARPELHMLVVVVLSTSAQRKDVEKACELGANSYLVKPSGSAELLRQMSALKAYWLEQHTFLPD